MIKRNCMKWKLEVNGNCNEKDRITLTQFENVLLVLKPTAHSTSNSTRRPSNKKKNKLTSN